MWIPVDVVREGDWHAVDERENTVEVTRFLIVTLQPRHFFCGEAKLLPDGVVRRRVLGYHEGDRPILVVRVLLRSLLLVVVLDVIVVADTTFVPDDVAWIRKMFAFAT